jgi:FtsP/CotA-like multicopper oxidase with cupredoxin domain
MDAARQPEPVARPVEVSISKLATTVFSVIALMLAFAALAISAGNDADAKTVAQGGGVAGAVPISLVDIALDPKVADADVDGVLQVTNKGAAPHSLAIEGEDLATETLNPAESAQLPLKGLEPGTYQMFCTISGHKEAGMTGELRIGAADQAGAASHAGHNMTAGEMDETMAVRTKAFPAKTTGLGGQPLAPTVLADGTKQFDLTTKVVDWEVEPGKVVKAMTYNGTVPGPTLKVAAGDKVRIVLHNEMDESTAIHFHGLLTPNAMDGVPDITQAPVKPGQSFTYEFTAKGPAVGMYHSHHNAQVQVPNGLAGTILVGDLPLPAGVTVAHEVPMMLNDAGVIGFSLNGKSFPATAPVAVKPGEWMLVHYLNEGVMAHPLHLHGLEQLVVAKDGFPLPQPYSADTINVAPGERYSVLVHANEPGVWAWHCHILPHAEREDGMFGMVTAVVVQ